MKTNARGVELIKAAEALRLNAYLCPAGVPTIGYGHTGDVKLGQTITRHQADVILALDLERFEQAVERMAPGANENEFSALVSFAFNVGSASLETSGLLRRFNAGDKQGAAREFAKWCHAKVGGVMVALPGLVKRRADEAALLLTPVTA
jgi:lysozyme